jgi:molybdopterin molybdotransferase
VKVLGSEAVPIEGAAGRVLREDLRADRDSPAIAMSAMDGYAIALDGTSTTTWPLVGVARTGASPLRLPRGACMRIHTGGPMPVGANAVLKQELAEVSGGCVSLIAPAPGLPITVGTHVRPAGANAKSGDLIIAAGAVITPSVLAALSCFGVARPTVAMRPRASVITGGDEVVDPVARPEPWQVRDTVAPALRQLVGSLGWVLVHHARVTDTRAEILTALASATESSDVVVIAGAVGPGDHDHVRPILEEIGCRVLVHGVNQRPGKPLLLAISAAEKPIVCLPGNPLSSLVTGHIVLPALSARLQGAATTDDTAPGLSVHSPDSSGLWCHRLVRVSAPGQGVLVPTASSGDVVAAARSEGFITVPPGASGVGTWSFTPWRR